MQHTMSDGNLNPADFFKVIYRRKKIISIVVTVTVVTAIIFSLITKPTYQAEVLIMQVESAAGSGGFLGQLGNLAPMLGFGGGIGGTSKMEQSMVLLRSSSLAQKIVDRFGLMQVFFEDAWDKKNNKWKSDNPKNQPRMEEAVDQLLNGYVRFINSKQEGTIRIRVEMPTPKLAADVANGYTEELQNFINKNAFTAAKKNRIFIENQLANNKFELLNAGKELNTFYSGDRISNIKSNLDVPVLYNDKVNDLNVDKLSDLFKEKEEVEGALTDIKSNTLAKGIPQQVYLQYLTIRRNLLVQINAMLSQHYEMAKIEESKDDLSFQVIDPAKEPSQRFKPKRKLIVMVSFMSSMFIGILAAFLLEYLEKTKTIH